MKKPKIKKLSAKIYLCSVLPIAVVYVIVSAIAISTVMGFANDLIKRETFSSAINVADRLGKYLDTIIVKVDETGFAPKLENYLVEADGVAQKNSVASYSSARMTLNKLYNLQLEGVSSVWLADFSGRCIFTDTDTDYSAEEQDFRTQSWYDSANIENASPYAAPGSALYASSDKEISVIFPLVNTETQKTNGVCGLSIGLDTIASVIGDVSFSDNGFSAVINADGLVIFYNKSNEVIGKKVEDINAELSRTVSNAHDAAKADIYEINYNDDRWYVKLSTVADSGFYACSAVPSNDVFVRTSSFIVPLIITIIGGFAAFFLLTFFLIRSIVAPIKNVTIMARDMSKGNYSKEITINSEDEIGTLVKTFNSTIQNLRYRTSHDPLTGIYNADGLFAEIEKLFIENPDKPYSLVRMDIDKFKIVNDLHGWDEGDNLLRYIGRVLSEEISDESVAGRYNADIFMMCLNTNDETKIAELLTRIKNIIGEYSININVMPYFGVYEVTDKYTPINMMFDRATLAVKSIKGNIVKCYAFYDDALRSRIILRKKIESDMDDALIKRQFYIVVQPKCDINTGRVVGGEALVRWNHPVDGVIRPDSFIPVFEQNGFVMKLDEFVWEETCRLISNYIKKGYKIVPISVNVSRLHIFDTSFCDKITGLVEKYKIPKGYLELEFTESAFLTNLTQLYNVMNTLKKRGFVLSMDDFASGYSSLNMLKNAPFDVVKIDREFITEAVNNSKGRKLINGTISLINQLDIEIIAEGVETTEQADFLVSSGCSVAQGFLYAKPLKVDEFERMAFQYS